MFVNSGTSLGYEVAKAVRLRADAAASFTKTFSVAGNRTKWTFSAWVKRTIFGGTGSGLLSDAAGGSYFTFSGSSFLAPSAPADSLSFVSGAAGVYSSAIYRDPGAYMHLNLIYDSAQATAADRVKLEVNGVQVALNGTFPVLNATTTINNNIMHGIGGYMLSGTPFLDGYMSEVRFMDGLAVPAASTGQFDLLTGAWVPKRYTGTYGANGFYLKFDLGSTTSAFGTDRSGNGNNWLPNNFALNSPGGAYDWVKDTPTNNYCIHTLLDKHANINLFSGGLTHRGNNASISGAANSTFSLLTGKWYWEYETVLGGGGPYLGVCRTACQNATNALVYGVSSGATGGAFITPAGGTIVGGFGFVPGASTLAYVQGDVMGCALDMDNGAMYFSKNGTWMNGGVPTSGALRTGATHTWTPGSVYLSPGIGGFNSNISVTNFGQRPFLQSAPTGFKEVCTKNLPQPRIKQPNRHFDIVAYQGNNVTPRNITGLFFQPDLLWDKTRNGLDDHIVLDSMRGLGTAHWLATNLTATEGIYSTNANVTSFNSDGYTIGTTSATNCLNEGSRAIVAWLWKAGGAALPNNVGTISSQVSVNVTSGFSIVKYVANNTNGATVGHGLGVPPAFIMTKKISAGGTDYGWSTYHQSNGTANIWTHLNSAKNPGNWPVAPTSAVFTPAILDYNNVGSETYINYCFAEVTGFSKFGDYVGNGSADGPFVHCGFRPKFIMTKRTDSTSDWVIVDAVRNTSNVAAARLYPNGTNVEDSADTPFDLLSNGFKCRSSNVTQNASGGTYIFIAFAEAPFKQANAR
jgi:hypothetical protein